MVGQRESGDAESAFPACRIAEFPEPAGWIHWALEALMLVLSRKRDESIIIGDDVIITVVDIKGEQVKLGVTAPQNVSIHRKEVYESIQQENQAAARSGTSNLSGLIKVLHKKNIPSSE